MIKLWINARNRSTLADLGFSPDKAGQIADLYLIASGEFSTLCELLEDEGISIVTRVVRT